MAKTEFQEMVEDWATYGKGYSQLHAPSDPEDKQPSFDYDLRRREEVREYGCEIGDTKNDLNNHLMYLEGRDRVRENPYSGRNIQIPKTNARGYEINLRAA